MSGRSESLGSQEGAAEDAAADVRPARDEEEGGGEPAEAATPAAAAGSSSSGGGKRSRALTTQVASLTLDWEELQKGFHINEEYPSGTYGEVTRAQYQGQTCAVKQLHTVLHEQSLKMFKQEIVQLTLVHENEYVARFVGAVCTPPDVAIVTEWSKYGTMGDLVRTKDFRFTAYSLAKTALMIAQGVQALHSKQIFHGNLKANNVLVTKLRSKRFVPKLTDFGMTRIKREVALQTGTLGSPEWTAPEVLQANNFDPGKADAFSFGVLLWEMLTGAAPFEGVDKIKVVTLTVFRHYRLPIPDECPPALAKVMRRCWSRLPEDRPTFKELVGTILPELCKSLDNDVDPLPRVAVPPPEDLTAVVVQAAEGGGERETSVERRGGLTRMMAWARRLVGFGRLPGVVYEQEDLPSDHDAERATTRFLVKLKITNDLLAWALLETSPYGITVLNERGKDVLFQHSWAHVTGFTLKRGRFTYLWKPFPGYQKPFTFLNSKTTPLIHDSAVAIMGFLSRALTEMRKKEKAARLAKEEAAAAAAGEKKAE